MRSRCRDGAFPARERAARKETPCTRCASRCLHAILGHVLLAEITTNVAPSNDPAFVLIDITTPEGKASGLDQNSLVSALFLATVFGDRIERVIGKLSTGLMQKVNVCLQTALGLP